MALAAATIAFASQVLVSPTATSTFGSWQWENPLPQGNDLAGISCLSPSACIAVGRSGSIIATMDGGATWTLQNSGTSADLAAVSCMNSQTCMVGGANGTLLVTATAVPHGRRMQAEPRHISPA